MIHLLSESFPRHGVVICATMRDICSRLSLGQVSRTVGLAYQKTLLDKDSLYLSTKANTYNIILEQECQFRAALAALSAASRAAWAASKTSL